jgi:hypothetical protein
VPTTATAHSSSLRSSPRTKSTGGGLVDLFEPPRIGIVPPGHQANILGFQFCPLGFQVYTGAHLYQIIDDPVAQTGSAQFLNRGFPGRLGIAEMVEQGLETHCPNPFDEIEADPKYAWVIHGWPRCLLQSSLTQFTSGSPPARAAPHITPDESNIFSEKKKPTWVRV